MERASYGKYGKMEGEWRTKVITKPFGCGE